MKLTIQVFSPVGRWFDQYNITADELDPRMNANEFHWHIRQEVLSMVRRTDRPCRCVDQKGKVLYHLDPY